MTTIELHIPDNIARLMNSFSQPKEEFVLEAIEEKIKREKGKVKLAERGIGESEASAQRAAFATFAEDWDSPEMDAYDKLLTRRCHSRAVSRFKSANGEKASGSHRSSR